MTSRLPARPRPARPRPGTTQTTVPGTLRLRRSGTTRTTVPGTLRLRRSGTTQTTVPGTLPASAGAAGPRIAAPLLGAACIAWTAAPIVHSGWASFTFVIAIIAVAAGALRLALTDVPEPEDQYFVSAPVRLWLWFLGALRFPPWEEAAVVALVWLEVIHSARPWHTFALGAGLIAYLLSVHVAESGTRSGRLLRSHAKVLTVGACLMAIAAGAAMLPAGAPGAGSALLRVLAAIAVVLAAALVLPA